MAGGGWGLIGNATAKVPGDLLAQILADAAAADEAKFKRAGEVQKRGIDLRDVAVREGGLGVQRGNLDVSRGNLDLAGMKRQDELSAKEREDQEFNQTLATAPEWLKPVLKFKRAAGVVVNPRDAAMSPEQQFEQDQSADLAKIGATATAQSGRDQQQHNFRLDEQTHAASLRPEPKIDKPPQMPSTVKSKVADIDTISKMIADVSKVGADNKWAGVGGFLQGSMKGFMDKNLGASGPGETVRSKIGNLRGTVAAMRAGLSMTKGEEEMLESYVPTVNMAPSVIESKLKSLNEWLKMKRASLTAQYGDPVEEAAPTQKLTVAELLKKYGGG